MTTCITCGDELHPERAKKYGYCMKPECQAKNLKGLTMVAVGVNKSAEQYMLLDEDTKADLARGKYHDQRRGTFGQPEAGPGKPAPGPPGPPGPGIVNPGAVQADAAMPAPGQPGTTAWPATATPIQGRPVQGRPVQAAAPRATPSRGIPASPRPPRLPGTPSQRRLALLYNQQGLRPDEIASKLGLSRYDVTQIILASPRRGKA
jgi:hypothetical protein